MASGIIHYAISCELVKKRQFNNPDRLKLGSVLVDSGYNGNSHMKISVAGGHKKTYDLDGYRKIYGELMKQDDLYLGYDESGNTTQINFGFGFSSSGDNTIGVLVARPKTDL
ncbi:MAG: hypothetical protein Q4A15_05620, partial [Prevotellaceae bacterium]|nr:hypothetical protein [Prevotellaceae bacterium]